MRERAAIDAARIDRRRYQTARWPFGSSPPLREKNDENPILLILSCHFRRVGLEVGRRVRVPLLVSTVGPKVVSSRINNIRCIG